MSKTGVIGIGVPLKSLRRKPQSPRRVCGFVVRASSFGGSMGGREPGRFHASGFPVRQPVEPPPSIGVECVGFSKPKPLEAIHGCIRSRVRARLFISRIF
jgi:hypothetical protein